VSANSVDELLRPRPVGKTGLMVTPIGVGGAPLGDMTTDFAYVVPEDRALDTVRAWLDSPINFMDTAAYYGDGTSERRIGTVLRERGGLPQGKVLETKADRNVTNGDWSGDQMRRSVERSLRLLGMDSLQICLLHDPETTTFEEITRKGGALEALVRMKEEGLIQHLGIGAGDTQVIMRYVELGVMEVVMTHNRFNLLDQEAEPLMDLCQARGIAVFNAAPYGSGILAKGPDAFARFRYREASPTLVERVRRMQAICDRHGVPLAAAALQFSIRDPRVTSTVVGMTRPERIRETIELATYPIPEDLWEELAPMSRSREGLPTGLP